MKIYRVRSITYKHSFSLLPQRDPEPAEVAPFEQAAAVPSGQEIIHHLIRMGYSSYQATHLYRGVYNHYWYDFGIRDMIHCNRLVHYWIQAYVAPVWKTALEKPPELLHPAVIYYAVVVGVIVGIMLLVNPVWESEFVWAPEKPFYFGTFHENLWWMVGIGVSATQVAFYQALVFQGAVITAYEPEGGYSGIVGDRISFWGTLEYRCWIAPYFRVFRAQYADCTFIGLGSNVGAHRYRLRGEVRDPFAVPGPFIVPPEEWPRPFSPCEV